MTIWLLPAFALGFLVAAVVARHIARKSVVDAWMEGFNAGYRHAMQTEVLAVRAEGRKVFGPRLPN